MPHVCTNCDRTFPDGSKEMLSGCPDCGGNKFQYRPQGGKLEAGSESAQSGTGGAEAGTDDGRGEVDPTSSSGDATTTADTGSSAAETVSNAASTLRDLVGGSTDAGHRSTPTDNSGSSPEESSPERSTRNGSPPDPGSATPAGPDPSNDGGSSTDSGPPTGSSPSSDPSPTPDWASSSDPSSTADPPSPTDSPSEVDTDFDGPDGGESGIAETEDDAQASARSSVAALDEIEGSADATGESTAPTGSDDGESTPSRGGPSLAANESGHLGDGTEAAAADGTDDTPDDEPASNLAELREELNDQFESIKIVEPGQYELNLMELYDRDEYIISLKEDGRYVIEVPETWRGNTP